MHSIVALHRLGGHAFNTWRFHCGGVDSMWLCDFLLEDIPNARILTYGYPANVIFNTSTEGIRSYVQSFLERLFLNRTETDCVCEHLLIVKN